MSVLPEIDVTFHSAQYDSSVAAEQYYTSRSTIKGSLRFLSVVHESQTCVRLYCTSVLHK